MTDILLTAYDGAILGPIAKLLGWIMNGIYMLMDQIGINNVGLSIILFTIVIYLLMFPLTYKQQKFSKLSQKMNPELQAVQKKYKGKNDQASMQAMQEETQLIYEKYGVSPMGSCVQMLIQMPLLLALYRVFMNVPAYVTSVKADYADLVSGIMATDGYQDKMASFVDTMKLASVGADFTVTDKTALSNYIVDVLYKMNSSGWDSLKEVFPSLSDLITSTHGVVEGVNKFIILNISDTPLFVIKDSWASHNWILIIGALLVPIISYATQMLNIKLMPQPSNGDGNDAVAAQMKTMNMMMPLFSFVICFTVPVGLGIYWIAGSVVRSILQLLLNKHFDKVDLEEIIKKNQEKAKAKREKMGIAENQISNAARMNTKKIAEPERKSTMTSAERELELEKAAAKKANAKSGSMASKANMVKEFNERNSRK